MKGIDVSSNQGSIDWPRVRASGIDFAFARCVREVGTVDERFSANIAGMRQNAIFPGAYCFLDEGSASAQAKLTIDAIRAEGNGLAIVLDVETGSGTLPSINDIRTWTGLVRNAFPFQPILVYGSPGVLVSLGNLAGWGPWWRADYGANPAGSWDAVYGARGGDASAVWNDDASGWTRAAVWQFSSRGSVPGVSGNVPLDATKLSRGQFELLCGLVSPESVVDALEDTVQRQSGIITTQDAALKDQQMTIDTISNELTRTRDLLDAAPGAEKARIAGASAEAERGRIMEL